MSLSPQHSNAKDDVDKTTKEHDGSQVAESQNDELLSTSDSHNLGARAKGGSTSLDPTSEEYKRLEKALVRKIDIRLMPIIILLYILNYLDRNSITTARDRGFVTDLGLTDPQYQTALSILYVGYISCQVPSNLLMTKLGRPSLYIPACVALWGVVSGCTAATQNYHDLLAVRILLGVVESAFFPGALALLSFFYRKNEMATRTALLFSGSIISNAFSGLISAGILGGLDGKAGLAGWRWLFIIEGAMTVVVALAAVFILPDFPGNSRFLSAAEREMAVNRLLLDAGTSLSPNDEDGTPMQGLMMAIKDVKVWILAFMLTAVTVGVGFNQFFPTLVGTLGYSKTVTLLLTAPIWFFAFLACLANGLHSDHTKERTFHIIGPLLLGIIGFIISSTTTSLGARFFALFIEASSYAGYTCVLGWIAPSIPTPKYKKAVALALINAFSQLGNISASYVFPKTYAPRYWQSYTICACTFVACILLVGVHRWILTRENRKLDALAAAAAAAAHPDDDKTHPTVTPAFDHHGDKTNTPDLESKLNPPSQKELTQLAMAKSNFRYML